MTTKPIRTRNTNTRLSLLMDSAGVTTESIMQRFGVTRTAVAAWRRGEFMPLPVQWQLAAWLGVTVDEMLGEWE